MAEAYAAVLSVQHIIESIQQHNASHIKSLDQNPMIEALRNKASFLQDFLEACYDFRTVGHDAMQSLGSRIADAAHAAEYILESHIVDRIHAISSPTPHKETSSYHDFDQSLEKVLQDMDFIIEEEVKKMKIESEKMEPNKDLDQEQPANTISSVPLPRSSSNLTPPPRKKNAVHMVGFDEYLNQLMEKLTGQGPDRQVIPIFGMGGIGKTTLAQNVYEHPLIMERFDRRAWATISQGYSVRDILSSLLRAAGSPQESGEDHELGEKLYKELYGRRYLIVLDDVWCIEAWNKVKSYFPDNGNGSRIVITTRISSLASHFCSCGLRVDCSCGLRVDFLDEDKSWDLFCQKVFGGEGCPDDLVELAKKIAEKCGRLPLSIITIGGLLANSKKTIEYWEYVLENLSSIIASDDSDRCLKILSLSYAHLPIHLKPCFLYMGVFPEDYEIRVSKLIRLWVAEGFLKLNKVKSLEEVAEEYLHDLIDRNLISERHRGTSGKVNTCNIHDLLREFCLKESQKEKFLSVGTNIADQDMKNFLRVAIHCENPVPIICGLESAASLYSITSKFPWGISLLNFRLLRVLSNLDNRYCRQDALKLFNLRHLCINFELQPIVPSSINLLWNLQTLYIECAVGTRLPSQIWEMPQLRHIKTTQFSFLPSPPTNVHDDYGNIIVLQNLQTISTIMNFVSIEEIARRMPNITKLRFRCGTLRTGEINSIESACCCPNNLDLLHILESLCLQFYECGHSEEYRQQQMFAFPLSLKKLQLGRSHLPWDSIKTIGALPHLEVLILSHDAFIGDEWDVVEQGLEFCSLKHLEIRRSDSPKYWNADETGFPHLERLVLERVYDLVEIPLGIGEIPTLQFIYVERGEPSVLDSAKRILEEQQSLGNDTLQVFTEDGPISLDDEYEHTGEAS